MLTNGSARWIGLHVKLLAPDSSMPTFGTIHLGLAITVLCLYYNNVISVNRLPFSVAQPMSNKSKILAAASDLLQEKGVAGLNVRAIAKRAGLSTIGIYSHFQGKQGILDALYIDGFQQVSDGVSAAFKIKDPKRAALAVTKNYLEMARRHEAQYRLIFGETNTDYTPSEEALRAGRQAFDRLVELTARLLPPAASKKHQQRIALRVWALVHGYVSLRHHAMRDIADKEWTRQVMAASESTIDSIMREERA